MLTRIKVQNCIDQIWENGSFTTMSWVLTKTLWFHKLMKITKFKDNGFHSVVRWFELFSTNLLLPVSLSTQLSIYSGRTDNMFFLYGHPFCTFNFTSKYNTYFIRCGVEILQQVRSLVYGARGESNYKACKFIDHWLHCYTVYCSVSPQKRIVYPAPQPGKRSFFGGHTLDVECRWPIQYYICKSRITIVYSWNI